MDTDTTTSQTVRRVVVEELYCEAMALADEARDTFDPRASDDGEVLSDEVRIALSIEGLRTTTRLMNVLAWLLNQRAFFDGELTEKQVRKSGGLPPERPPLAGTVEKLPLMVRSLVRESERLHDRVARIDADWRASQRVGQSPGTAANDANALQSQLKAAFAA